MITAEQRIKLEILRATGRLNVDAIPEAGIDDAYDAAKENDDDAYGYVWDEEDEFRQSGEPSGLQGAEPSRHYESVAVARQFDDGVAVAWTEWSGGGKHGQPGAIDWMTRPATSTARSS